MLRLDEVYDQHFDFAWRMLRRLGVPDANLDDAVQDVFVSLHRRLADYDGRASVRSWLYGFVSYVARDHRRLHKRKFASSIPPPADSAGDLTLAANGPSPLAQAEQSEKVALLKRLLDEMDDKKREILVLAYLEEMTVPEIADLLSINLNTAYSRLRAAKQAFDVACAASRTQEGKQP